jgi:hypothetical protein
MDDLSVTREVRAVGIGNQEVLEYYTEYNCHPGSVILEQLIGHDWQLHTTESKNPANPRDNFTQAGKQT